MVARRGKSLGQQLQELFAKVGSFCPLHENFRLTPEVKEKFTEELRLDPEGFAGRKVNEVVGKDGLQLVLDGWFLGVLPALGNGACGPGLFRSIQPPGSHKLSTAAKQWIFE